MIHILDDEEQAVRAAATFFTEVVTGATSEGKRCSVALSGGSSPRKMFRELAANRNSIDWKKTDFFFGDERHVPQDSPDSNFRMARENLLDPAGVPADQIFAVNTQLSPAAAALDYEAQVLRYFDPSRPQFDLILLGLGDDAHTASLFPGTEVLDEKAALVKSVYVKKMSSHRVTFTARLINDAHNIAFLVYGSAKSTALKNVMQGPHNPSLYPAQLVKPSNGAVHWFVDRSAAAALK